MENVIIENMTYVANEVAKFCGDDVEKNGVIIGYYDDVCEAFNTLMKDTNTLFVSGELWEPEYNGYDGPYYIEYSPEEIFVGKAYYKEDNMMLFEPDIAYVDKDFINEFLKSSFTDNVVCYSYDGCDEDDNNEDDICDHYGCICFDEDKCGFKYCTYEDDERVMFCYRGSKKLTEIDAVNIIAKNLG